jgi:lipooligosaccharide transport system ATP-binding protein
MPVLDGIDGLRLETVGESHFCYTDALGPVLERLEKASDLTFMHRPANLEDVFLRLTGHDLRD